MRRRARLGARSRARIRTAGKLAQGRPSVSLARWREIVGEVMWRAGGRCEVSFVDACGSSERCCSRGEHPHHVVARSAGGADTPENLIWICAPHHRAVEAPYRRGRLLIRALGAGFFSGTVVCAADKFAARGRG